MAGGKLWLGDAREEERGVYGPADRPTYLSNWFQGSEQSSLGRMGEERGEGGLPRVGRASLCHLGLVLAAPPGRSASRRYEGG